MERKGVPHDSNCDLFLATGYSSIVLHTYIFLPKKYLLQKIARFMWLLIYYHKTNCGHFPAESAYTYTLMFLHTVDIRAV